MTSLAHHHYNPDWLSDDALLANFVARQNEFAFLRDELARSPLTGNVQHYLLVGLRGAGKTTLLKRLAVAIRRDDNLSGHLIALSFPEELYQVKNLADFWWAACDALADELDFLKRDRDADDLLAAVTEARSGAAKNDSISNVGFGLLQQMCARLKRRPVLLVDNLDVVFERIDKTGRKLTDPHSPAYWALREALSTSTSPIVIGGSVRLSSHFTNYDNAFYDFFIAKRLGKLSLPEVLEVLDRLADTKGVPEVKQRLRARPGRLESLFELTGGNPRALGLIFELLCNGPNSRTVEDFERLMDLTTPYYKARIEDLSEQAQVVMHALAVRRVGAGASDHLRFGHTAAEIGDHAGLATNTVSTQLGILENEGLVEKSAAHGRTQYRIAEQLFRLWLQMRGTRRVRQNVLELTKFFEAMYDADELLKMAMEPCGASELAEAKYAIAVAASDDTPAASREVLERYATEQLRQHVAKNGGEMEDYLPAVTDEVLSRQTETESIEPSIPTNSGDSIFAIEEAFPLPEADPTDTLARRNLAVHYAKMGDLLVQRGDQAGALASHEAALAIHLALSATDPTNTQWQRDLSVSHSKIGSILAARGDQAGALASNEAAFAIRLALSATDSTNTLWQRDLSVSHSKIGGILTARGDLAGALVSHEAALAIRLALSATDPTNTQWQRDLSVSHERIGDILAARDDLAGALASHEAALAIRLALSATDPTNTLWQRDLSVSHERIGDILAVRDDLAGALASHEAALAIRLALSATDSTNTLWQRDLSVSHEKIGDILAVRDDLAGALASHEAALAIRLALSATDPTNTLWQRDLSVSHERIGGILAARDDLAGALAFYETALAIFLALSTTDPTNTLWQRDLSVSHERIGDILAARDDLAGALASNEAALAICLALSATDPTNTQWQRDLSVSHERIGDILAARGDLTDALASYEAALAIKFELSEANSYPCLSAKHADLRASIYAAASRHAFASGDPAALRNALTCLIADPVDIAAVLVSRHVIEDFLAPALVNVRSIPMLLNEMRDLGYEKHARPLVLAFEAAMMDRADLLTELEPEIQAATIHMFGRLRSMAVK